jgi:large subunit ribosomal protein L18
MAKHVHLDRKQKRDWRKIRIRKRLSGTATAPRLCVFRSSHYIYVQAVDDTTGATIAAASSLEPAIKDSLKTSGKHVAAAAKVGELVSERLKAKGIEQVVFDRGGYLYHGRVKALAEGARKGGLQF